MTASMWVAVPAPPAAADGGGTQRWSSDIAAIDVVTSPDGATVFLTGSALEGSTYRVATIAHDAETGVELWRARLENGRNRGAGYAIALGPGGETVFVAGRTTCPASMACDRGAAFVAAYDADTGRRAWSSHLASTGYREIEVSPDGSRVFLHGMVSDPDRVVTVAFDAGTGREVWRIGEDHPDGWNEVTGGMAAGPHGNVVYVADTQVADWTETFEDGCSRRHRITAYDGVSGTVRWRTTFSLPGTYCGITHDIALSPDGSVAYVTGAGGPPNAPLGHLYSAGVVALDTGDGSRRWHRIDDAVQMLSEYVDGVSAVVSPDGSRVVVSGERCVRGGIACSALIPATIAYDAATGASQWSAFHEGDDFYLAHDLAMSPDGASVYLTGRGGVGAPVVAYDSRTGEQRWSQVIEDEVGNALAVSPDSSDLYVAASASLALDTGSGSRTVQDADRAVTIDGWRSFFHSGAEGGAYRASRRVGDTVTFRTPRSSSLSWLTRVGPGQGRARLTVDGRVVGTYDLAAARAQSRRITVRGLAKRRHSVRVQVLAPRDGTGRAGWVSVDAFEHRIGAAQESSSALRYGSWAVRDRAAGATVRTSRSRDARISYEFRGRAVRWVTMRGRASGRALVTVDGRRRIMDLYRTGPARRAVVSFRGLGRGRHVITVRPLGTRDTRSGSARVAVDAFEVRG